MLEVGVALTVGVALGEGVSLAAEEEGFEVVGLLLLQARCNTKHTMKKTEVENSLTLFIKGLLF